MRLMITTLALCVAALLGAAPASAGALQSPATVSAVDNTAQGAPPVQNVRYWRYGYGGFGSSYGAPYSGYSYSFRPRYYSQPYAYYYPAPRYYGYYYAPQPYYYKRGHRHHHDDWDD